MHLYYHILTVNIGKANFVNIYKYSASDINFDANYAYCIYHNLPKLKRMNKKKGSGFF